MVLQRILFGIGWLTLGVVLLFFLWGLADGTVSPVNLHFWVLMMGVPAAMVWAAGALRAKGWNGAAMIVLGLLAVPAILLGVVIAVFIIAPPDFR